MTTYQGSCHCGAVVFEIDTEFTQFSQCNCTLCTKKNAVMAKVHKDHFRLVRGEEFLALYQWNTKTARHHFCKHCGIYTFHRKRVTPDFYGVNVYCLDDTDLSGVAVVRMLNGLDLSVVEN